MITASPVPSGQLLPAIWKLIRLQLLLGWNSFKHGRTRRKVLTILLVILVLAVAGGLFYLSWFLLGFLNSPTVKQYAGIDLTAFLQSVPVLVLAVLFLGILFSSFGVLLQAMYLSGDMEFLLTSPVPIRAVFVTKMLQAILPNFGLIALFGLPLLVGLGLSNHYNLLYYLLLLLTMVALTLAAAGLSAVLVMLVARLFPPRRVAEVLGLLTATLSLLCGQSGNFYNAVLRNTRVSGAQVNGFLSLLMRLNTPWNPLNWAGRGLVDVGRGHWLSGLFFALLALGLSSIAFLAALSTAERWYYTGWARVQVASTKKKPLRARRAAPAAVAPISVSPLSSHGTKLLHPAVRAVIQKDFLLLRRDMRNMSALISPLIFGVLYTFMFLRPGASVIPQTSDVPQVWTNISQFINIYGGIGMSLFVGWMLMTRLAGMAFSSEGRNYWILKSSPVRSGQLLLAKFLVAWLPALALGLIFLVAVSLLHAVSLPVFLYGLLVMVMCQAGMNGINLSFGVLGANFTWTDPRHMGSGGIGCLGQFLTALFLMVSFAVFIGPLLVVSVFNWPQAYGYLVGLPAGVLLSLACALLPPILVRGRVARLAE